MPRNISSSTFMKPFVVLALPGMYLFYKYNQYKRQQREQNKRKVTEQELACLNHKIDKLLITLDENEPELATSQEDECVICVNAKATMQTAPCGHRVVCRKCFVKTIQMAVSQRLLPLRCVICRAKILRLKQTASGSCSSSTSSSLLLPSTSGYSLSRRWVPSSASDYSISGSFVPNSDSFYSVTSGSSSFSGVSSVSSATNFSGGCACSPQEFRKASSWRENGCGTTIRQPMGTFRKTQAQSMKYRIQEYKEPIRTDGQTCEKPSSRLPPIKEFQRDFKAGKERPTSTRIRCAQKIVTQLETTPSKSKQNAGRYYSFGKTSLKPEAKASLPRSESMTKECTRSLTSNNDNKKSAAKKEVKASTSNKKEDPSNNSSAPNNSADKINNTASAVTSNTKEIDPSKNINNLNCSDTESNNNSNNCTKSNSSNVNTCSSSSSSHTNINCLNKSVNKPEAVRIDKAKEEKKELTKSEKKELKKEAKAEKKNAKREAKLLKKELKSA